MASFTRFEEIKAWQIARQLVRKIYGAVEQSECRFDLELRRQLTSAGVSVMSNIAEGFGRRNDGDFLRFLDISRASACEVQSLTYVCIDVQYMREELGTELRAIAEECISAVAGLQAYLRESRTTKRGM